MVPCLELFFYHCYDSRLNISLALTMSLAPTGTSLSLPGFLYCFSSEEKEKPESGTC